jgi:hypothetical protein
LHEAIESNQPRRLFFDIDLETANIKLLRTNDEFMQWICGSFWFGQSDADIANALCDTLEYTIKCLLHDMEVTTTHYMFEIFTRHRDHKYSFHMLIKNVYVHNYMQQKAFCYDLQHGSGIPKILFDLKIIDNMDKKTQHFAVPYCKTRGLG